MILDLFSKRRKKIRGDVPELYTYNAIPEKLRIQVLHIMIDVMGKFNYDLRSASSKSYTAIHDVLAREYGVFSLSDSVNESPGEKVLGFLLKAKEADTVLDVIEVIFQFIDRTIRVDYSYSFRTEVKLGCDDAISELNERFKEHGIGYAFESGEIIRIDSTFIHAEVMKPALSLLQREKYRGANEEFLKAHEHYRQGRNKECLVECLKAFESTIKIICNEKKWSFNQTDTAKRLIQICFENGLVPLFSQNQFTSLQNLLESGIPTLRNKLGGHGQGALLLSVDDSISRYALNLTGSNIIFLVEQSQAS